MSVQRVHITNDVPIAASASSGAATIGIESKNKATYSALLTICDYEKTYHDVSYCTEHQWCNDPCPIRSL